MDAEKTNYGRIQTAVTSIKESEAALDWLQQHGAHIVSQKENIGVIIEPRLASACNGAKEAARVLAAYTRLELPKIIETAVRSCLNTIEIERAAIAEELAKQ